MACRLRIKGEIPAVLFFTRCLSFICNNLGTCYRLGEGVHQVLSGTTMYDRIHSRDMSLALKNSHSLFFFFF